jgi:hypothetical protein
MKVRKTDFSHVSSSNEEKIIYEIVGSYLFL